MFERVLVANRGEIAVRVMRTLRRLGCRTLAVYSDADRDARHVHEADVAARIGPAAAARSYLDIDVVVRAAVEMGAEAVHPGYGFLAENAAFARACDRAGLVFIGPPASAIELMGDKISAKQTVEKAGVPVVPGVHRLDLSDADIGTAAEQIGYPVLLKPSAGGGGKGMRRVSSPAELPEALAGARREAMGSFGDATLLVERYVDRPRHIEIQVLADEHGHVIHLGERECSLQRRHQKIVEEAPSPLLTPGRRAAMGESAVQAALACGYVGAGTVEFIASGDRPDDYFFMEMNTRLQVEHPVTEMVTGLDLVEEQIRCAAGEQLRLTQEQVELRGHSVEARVYAENPARDFLPTGGRILVWDEPAGEHVRTDAGVEAGSVVGTHYDPMLAKVIAWGPDRATAVRRLDLALADTVLLGVPTNVGFLRALLLDDDVRAGQLDTGLVERRLPSLVTDEAPDDAVVAAALGRLAERSRSVGADPFDVLTGWRLGGTAWTHERLQSAGAPVVDVSIRGRGRDGEVRIGDGEPLPAYAVLDGSHLTVDVGGRSTRWRYVSDGDSIWVGQDGRSYQLREVPPVARRDDRDEAGGPLLAPMPGTVTAVHVAPGDVVAEGDPVAAVEAMKMEHVVRATVPGTVGEVHVAVGDTVALEEPLVVVDAADVSQPRKPDSNLNQENE